MKTITLSGLLITLTLPLTSHAALVAQDFLNPGDGLITYDTATQLQWLNTNVMAGLNYNQVNQNLQNMPIYQGFQYADIYQVGALFNDGGIFNQAISNVPGQTVLGGNGSATNAKLQTIQMLGGITHNLNNPNSFDVLVTGFLTGYNGDIGSGGAQYTHETSSNGTLITFEVSLGLKDFSGGLFNATTPSTGNWLVRPAAVPVPAAAWLFGSGLLSVLGLRRRRSAA